MQKTKLCSKCKTARGVQDFYKNVLSADGLPSTCKFCQRATDKEYRKRNRKKILARQAEYKRQWFLFIKAEQLQCSVCGYSKEFSAIEFHHCDPSKKEVEISKFFGYAYNKKNRSRLLQELKKCRILCANCHRELHAYLKRKES